MKLKVKTGEDLQKGLKYIRETLEEGPTFPAGWNDSALIELLFEVDNTITFADLEPGQWFVSFSIPVGRALMAIPRTQARVYGACRNAISLDGALWEMADEDVVTPGKLIDGKFVPDEERE